MEESDKPMPVVSMLALAATLGVENNQISTSNIKTPTKTANQHKLTEEERRERKRRNKARRKQRKGRRRHGR